jgi:methionyl-tRNA synthetase
MISFEDFKKLDLRVAKVLEVREHPNADRLYLLRIDAGDEPKQIVAGIRTQYPPEELLGRNIVIVNNLEKAVIRGEESNGMLLAAKDGTSPIILVPERDVPPGSTIG